MVRIGKGGYLNVPYDKDSKGTDQPTHLYKLVCSYTVGIHENISN